MNDKCQSCLLISYMIFFDKHHPTMWLLMIVSSWAVGGREGGGVIVHNVMMCFIMGCWEGGNSKQCDEVFHHGLLGGRDYDISKLTYKLIDYSSLSILIVRL